MDVQLWCQALSLLACNFWYLLRAIILLPWALLRCVLPGSSATEGSDGVAFYEGVVTHHRRLPVSNEFK